MPTATAAELATLRSQIPNTARITWYLALAPYGDAVFTARVNNPAAANGDRAIIYDNDVGEADVEAGMTLWVGSSAEAYDVGRVRIRSIDVGANTITVAENNDIEWADDLYICCPGEVGFRELWGVYPRITEAGGVVTFYEDYDLTYNDPVDDVIPPKANAGPPVCAFLNSDGYVDVEFFGDESFTTEVGAAIASYLWDFSDGVVQSGGVAIAGTCAVPNVVRFSSPGFRYVSLTVTDNTAQTRTGTVYVPVWIFDDDEPPLSVQVEGQTGNPNWRLNVRAFQTNDTDTSVFYDWPDGALCVLFTATTYPDGSNDIGGVCHRENIRYMGWLDSESLTFDYVDGTVQFSVISHDLRLKQLPGFAYTLEDEAAPGDWYQVADLDLDRALHTHLERRTTTNQVCHVERLGEGSTRPISVQPFSDASLYDQAQEHLLKDAMATLTSDRQGVLRVRRDPQFMSVADRAAVEIVADLTYVDLLNEIDESKVHQDVLGYVRLGGFSYETPLLAEAPGVAPSQSEASTHTEGFIVVDQDELNLWAGCWWAKENNDFKAVPVEMPGYWPVFDPAFQEYVRLTLTDPLGRNVWSNQRFIIRQVVFGDLAGDGTCRTQLILEKDTSAAGTTVTIEAPPPPAAPPPPPGVVINPVAYPEVAVVHNREKIYSTPDFDALNPTWTDITGAINGTGVILAVEVDFYDGVGGWALTATDGIDANDTSNTVGLWRTNDITVGAPVWNLVFTQLQASNNRTTNWIDCDFIGLTRPTWGQLRTIQPNGPGSVIVAEARYQSITGDLRDKTDFWEVDSAGVFLTMGAPDILRPDTWAFGGGWGAGCDQCNPTAPDNAGDKFWGLASYVNQAEFRSCYHIYGPFSGYKAVGCGILNLMQSAWCTDDSDCAPTCFVKIATPVNPDATLQNYQEGCTHIVNYGGVWWGQVQSPAMFGGSGAVYNEIDGELDGDLWSNYAFCNLCSHPEAVYWCKQDSAVTARTNKLVRAGVDTGVTSDLLFGGNGPGYNAGVIGHIRAMWDEDRTVVMVRKDEPDVGQPNQYVVWTWDPTNGLQNKTGNLTGITWYGTGQSLSPVGWNYRWDNVGFSAFNVPLR